MRPQKFGQDITNTTNNNHDDRDNEEETSSSEAILERLMQNGATPIAHIAGKGIIKVVSRCETAKENNNLDLSECSLMSVPDAVYHLMRHTELKSCDLSGNVISKITPKFAMKFNLITELNLSHNQMAKLPDELVDLKQLKTLDISSNSFLTLPNVVFKLKNLSKLIAHTNKIFEIDFDLLDFENNCLELVDLRFNPLIGICLDILRESKAKLNFKIEFSERKKEEWEDLDI